MLSAVRSRFPAQRLRSVRRFIGIAAAACCLCMAAATAFGQDERPYEWLAGAYSFSDELGGFTINSVSGSGTRTDPIVIRETLDSSSPVTLVIRAKRPIRPFDSGTFYANGILYMRIVTRNGSGQGWLEFAFELQEQLNQPSVFGDGLSFDQRAEDKDLISSDSFAEFSRDFEPYDRLLFRHGKVDPAKSAGFSFLITDFTPKAKFYLVQDPRIPSS
jgi:hypothetical protein